MPVEFSKVSKSISEIYYLANTPSFIYNIMSRDQYVQSLAEYSSEDLIETFKTKANSAISTFDEMALMYAILVALTLKPINEVRDFFKYVEETIKFEWFGEIIKLYFNNYKPSPIITNINIQTENKITIFNF